MYILHETLLPLKQSNLLGRGALTVPLDAWVSPGAFWSGVYPLSIDKALDCFTFVACTLTIAIASRVLPVMAYVSTGMISDWFSVVLLAHDAHLSVQG
jgi:hypothetical protein